MIHFEQKLNENDSGHQCRDILQSLTGHNDKHGQDFTLSGRGRELRLQSLQTTVNLLNHTARSVALLLVYWLINGALHACTAFIYAHSFYQQAALPKAPSVQTQCNRVGQKVWTEATCRVFFHRSLPGNNHSPHSRPDQATPDTATSYFLTCRSTFRDKWAANSETLWPIVLQRSHIGISLKARAKVYTHRQ